MPNLKNGIEKLIAESQPTRIYPKDIIEGFKNIGYEGKDLDSQFDAHKSVLMEDENSKVPDDQVYSYMRDHLADKLVYPKHVNYYKEGSEVDFNGVPHRVIKNKGYNDEFDEDDLIIRPIDKKDNYEDKNVGSRQLFFANKR